MRESSLEPNWISPERALPPLNKEVVAKISLPGRKVTEPVTTTLVRLQLRGEFLKWVTAADERYDFDTLWGWMPL